MKRLGRILNVIRLAAFPLGYGVTGALVGGVLNRVLIADLAFSAGLVGLMLAIPTLVSPARLWLGYRSDGFPVLGRRREPYIVLGALGTGAGVVLAAFLAVRAAQTPVLLAGVVAAFVLYGLGRNLAHNTFEALLADTFSGDQRPRAMTVYEVATLLGLVMGSGALGKALETYDPARLVAVSLGAMALAFGLAVLAAVGQETPSADMKRATERARQMAFGRVLREVVTGDPQVRRFFTLILFTIVGTLAQDVLLEPYGALVLGMPVGETTRLTMFWGLGVMASMLLSGLVLVKRLGYLAVLRAGIGASLLVFVGVVVTGLLGDAGLFRGLVVLMGLGTGLAGAGLLAGYVSFTTPVRAGLLMGVWGMGNLLGRALGSIAGGTLVDVVQALTGGNALAAYSSVFALEAALLAVAWGLSLRLDLGASRARLEEHAALGAAGD
jgi:BCD family chlorophyll transporter-like MFS transporter